LSRDSFLYLLAPVNRFTYSKDCTAPLTVFYNDTSILPDTYFWNFGDGATSTLADPNHTYSATGQYTVIHTVTNATTGCSDTDTLSLTLTNTSSSFVAVTPRTGCAPLSVTFDIIGSGIIGRTWTFGDGTTSSGSDPVHVYTQPGVYNVGLILRYSSGCIDTLFEAGYVVVNGPQATFSVDTTFSCDSVFAVFTGSSTSAITNWSWDFGDGSSGNGQTISHSYLTTGVFPVELTVTEVSGCTSTVSLPSAVSILPLPFPDFEVDDENPCPGQEINFHRLFSAAGLSVSWDFGDGSTSNQANSTHVYSSPGIYSVSVTVTNANGCSKTNTLSNLIHIAIPTANFSAAPTVANCPPLLASFTDQSSSDVISWQWDFGDGTNSVIENPGHLYVVSGNFQVGLVVTNANGCKDSLLVDSLISVRGPYGSFTFGPDTLGCPPYLITFTATAFNTTDYTWDFGDGEVGNGATITHLFQNLGSYLPNLLLENANTGCSFTIAASDSISISPLPVFAGLDQTICLGESVQLQASGGTGYLWGPSNGLNNDTLSNPLASPNQTTDYIVTVVKGLCSNSDTVRVIVRPNPLAGFISDSVCEGNLTNFTNLSTNDSLSSTFAWDFGGNSSTVTNPTYLFPGFGTYPVQLIVSSSNGCVDTIRQNVVVHAVPSWDAIGQNVCLNQAVDFSGVINIGQGAISAINWDFGDGTSQTSLHPIHTYLQADTFGVTSIATSDQGCTDTSRLDIVIYPLPMASFSILPVCLRETSTFIDSSTIASGNINQWNWSFGDGTSSTQPNPLHVYQQDGTYEVTLVVNSAFGCSDTLELAHVIHPLPQVQFSATTDSSCFSPVQVNFNNQTTGASQYIWTYGNADSSNGFAGQVLYDSAGNYPVQLVAITNLGCRDSIAAIYSVYPTPIADFSVVDPIGCEPFLANFNNTSQNAITYSWGFGDGQNSSEQEPFHVFETAGLYSISLTITGQGGCQNSVFMPGMIQVLPRPFADFNYTVQSDPQIDGTVFFTNQSVDNVSSSWNLGDGFFSTENDSLVHQYEFWGNKDVLLLITAANGCTDTIEKTVRIGFFGGLFVPNALVLGGDGEFGIFLPKGKGLKEYRLTIWDEWGNLIFETQKLENSMPSEGWNGYYKGEPVPLDAYFWKIEARFENGEYWIGKEVEPRLYKDAGTVTVIR
ncbi:MAG: PKD domain-containing protein, partial [Bacteroidia bacterium]|nr:PKD domain-containing protein [Bacteroidia bacterium]